jgi:Peptidase family M28/PDZ domain
MRNTAIVIALILLNSIASPGQVKESRLEEHIKVLASDSLMGRGTGTSGEKMAASYIEKIFKENRLVFSGNEKSYRQSFPFKAGVHGFGREGMASNLVGFIDNQADKTVIIGAHYDHLGLGHDGNSLDVHAQDKIHNGADDNASGVAGLLELARYFQNNNIREKNNFLFLCFSGEELGLVGSKYFTEHPSIDLSSVNYMINLDMIGRLDPTQGIAISGTGTSSVWEDFLKRNSEADLKIRTDSSGMGPSDHSSFYLKNIPVLHFFTGPHGDYHKPSDDWDKINYKGEVEILNFIIALIESLDSQPKLTFLPTKNKSLGSARDFKVTMGIMPSYTSSEEGLRIDGVSEGKPAQRAGLKSGDVILQVGELKIKNIQDYMDALGKFEKGQTVIVRIKRRSEIVSLPLKF